MSNANTQFNATVGGIVFSILPWLDWTILLQTIILASIGAVCSLGVSWLFQRLFGKPRP